MATLEMTVAALAELVGGTLAGDGSRTIRSIASIAAAGDGDLTFAINDKHAASLVNSKAAAALVTKPMDGLAMPLVVVPNVEEAMAVLLGSLATPADLPPVGVDESAVIAPDAVVSPEAAIGPFVVVGARAVIAGGAVLCAHVCVERDAQVGQGALLEHGVVVMHECVIGRDVRIGANSVIGRAGFGYYLKDGRHVPIPHAGNVVIEDDVHIGPLCNVDRAKFGSTVIARGARIDSQVLIAHNVRVGAGCILCGHCGVAGSAELGQYVVLAGNVGVKDHVRVGNGVQCAAFAAIASDIADGEIVSGIPAQQIKENFRQVLAMKKLPDLVKRVGQIETRLDTREAPKND
ncbi:MAG: UDP-3-O-(3-hydroxymyristoyl)glucosamine N-acyltransferase [Planctomycetaceae bacterium]|nr:UDP-3-O-(3-hydroxymyristoyl)glucosamine N-acyltransferase [Planctomycetaceae bacterium]